MLVRGSSFCMLLGFFAQNFEHLGAAHRACARHCLALLSAFAGKRDLFRVLHLALLTALHTICYLCHKMGFLITKSPYLYIVPPWGGGYTKAVNYNIKGTGVSISDEIRGYLEKKLEHLEKFVRHVDAARIDVELEYDEVWDGPKYRAELTHHEPGLSQALRADVRGTTLHEAIDLAVGELTHDLTKTKQKKHDIFRRTGTKVKEYLRGWRNKV
jgi:ribosomal subunit interface protein